MNTNSSAIRVLCYGDSNTWGDPPDGKPRYSPDVRWTGLLQKKLGYSYEIIEEGLCGRTTVLDDPKDPGRNGKTYLTPCLLTHNPVDLVVLMLGTNDLKERFDQSAEQVAANVEALIAIIKTAGQNVHGESPKILLSSPVVVNEHSQVFMDGMKGAEEKSKQFATYYQEVAQRQQTAFVNMAGFVDPSPIDGCHLEKEAHAKIAEILEEKIRSVFLDNV